MSAFIDLNNKKFGHLTVIKQIENTTTDKHIMWLCLCDCGNKINVTSTHLISGHTISCGHVRFDADNSIRPGYEKKRVDGVAVFLLDKNRKKRTDNTTGITGVKTRTLKDGTVKYLAQIGIAGKRHHLGTFDTLAEAKQARGIAENNLIPKK